MNITDLLTLEEGKTLEFKRDLSSPKGLMKTLIAFANTAGGKVIIGVDDKTRQPVGVDSPLDEEERLGNLIADSILPRMVPSIEMITIDNKTLLIVEVFLSNSRPHHLKTEGPESGVYVRLGSTNRQADLELVAELRRSVEGIAFDELPMPDLSLEDLDIKTARKFFQGHRQLDEQGLITLKLLRREQGRLVPTKGAVLLFGLERTLHFPEAWIQCGRFIGQDKTDIFDHIELDEHLPQAVESVLLFLKKHAMRGADFSGIQRKDVWSIPLAILREVIINAIVHSDYSQRGAPIRIAYFDDRIEVENPGILLPGMTVEDMMQGISKIRNPVIARVFRELRLIEQWGSGVPSIMRQARELGIRPPRIQEIGMRLRFTVFLPRPQVLEGQKSVSRSAAVAGRVSVETKGKSSEKILLLLTGNPKMTIAELAGELGVTTRAVEKNIKMLKNSGQLERIGPAKGGHWKVLGDGLE
jgi:ATP-dependent DNA helicase RecG